MNLQEEYERLKVLREQNIESTGTLTGECLSFCPYFETIDRQFRKDLNKFEIQNNLLIKKYQRSAAGKTKAFPEDIRPVHVLDQVVNHLLGLLNVNKLVQIYKNAEYVNLYSNKELLNDLYKFVEDRLRAVRLDIAVQNARCANTIQILETIIRFYIVFNHLLFDFDQFEIHLNNEQLKRTLNDLMELYKINSIKNSEFVEYFLLVNISDPEIFKYENSKALRIVKYYHQNNYYYFFEHILGFNYLSICCLLPVLIKFSQNIIKISKSSIIDKVDVDFFIQNIKININELFSIIEREGIEIVENKVCLKEKTYKEKEFQIKRSGYDALNNRSILCIEFLIKNGSYDKIIRNCILGEFIKNELSKKNISLLIANLDEKSVYQFENDNITQSMAVNLNNKQETSDHNFEQTSLSNNDVQYLSSETKIYENNEKIAIKNNNEIEQIFENNAVITFLRKTIIKEYTIFAIINYYKEANLLKYVKPLLNHWKKLLKGRKNVLFVFENIREIKSKQNWDITTIEFKNINGTDLSNFHYILFIIQSKFIKKAIQDKFYMYNYFLGTIQDYESSMRDNKLEEKIINSKKVIKERLFNLIKNKNRKEISDILHMLSQNKKNSAIIEKNILNHQNHGRIIDTDVFYEVE